jgi:hypothetical protein
MGETDTATLPDQAICNVFGKFIAYSQLKTLQKHDGCNHQG